MVVLYPFNFSNNLVSAHVESTSKVASVRSFYQPLCPMKSIASIKSINFSGELPMLTTRKGATGEILSSNSLGFSRSKQGIISISNLMPLLYHLCK